MPIPRPPSTPGKCEYTPAMTYEEIGEALGVSGNRIHQICERALEKIRAHPEACRAFREAVLIIGKRSGPALRGREARLHARLTPFSEMAQKNLYRPNAYNAGQMY